MQFLIPKFGVEGKTEANVWLPKELPFQKKLQIFYLWVVVVVWLTDTDTSYLRFSPDTSNLKDE